MAPTKPLITVIGSLNIDYVTTTPRCPGPGETLTATSLSISAGGKGANQAVGCGKASFVSPTEQDVEVQMVGAVGKDDLYVERLLVPMLKESGVRVGGVKACEDAQTGTATIVVESDSGENRIMVVAGANHSGMGQVDEILSRSTVHGREPDVVVMQGEIPRDTVLGLLEHFNARSTKTQVIFNPAPIYPNGITKGALDGLAVLVVNEVETQMLAVSLQSVGFDVSFFDKEPQTLSKEQRLGSIAQQFHDLLGIELVLMTLGGEGSFFSSRTGGVQGLVPAAPVNKVVDTTAAGDTFVGYIAAALARHTLHRHEESFDIAAAVGNANRAAAKCVQKAGAMQSIPFGYE